LDDATFRIGELAKRAGLNVSALRYLQGIDNTEVISTIHARRAPTMPASAGLLM
jgi:hypothetical protein